MAMGPLLIAICNSDGFQCSAKTKGLLLSAFSLGYLSSQVFGGVLADRIGAEAVVFISSIGGALLMAASGFASTVSELWLCQVLMGVCHGPLFPTSIAFLTKWIPADERAFASTLLDTGITAGAMIALPFSGLLASAFGWRHTFMLYALGSLAFAIIWLALASSDPADCKYISSEEEAYLRSAVPQPLKAAARVTWPSLLKLLAHPAVLSIFLAHAAFNYCVYFINSWSPTFYQAPVSSSPICLSFSSHSHLPASHLNLVCCSLLLLTYSSPPPPRKSCSQLLLIYTLSRLASNECLSYLILAPRCCTSRFKCCVPPSCRPAFSPFLLSSTLPSLSPLTFIMLISPLSGSPRHLTRPSHGRADDAAHCQLCRQDLRRGANR